MDRRGRDVTIIKARDDLVRRACVQRAIRPPAYGKQYASIAFTVTVILGNDGQVILVEDDDTDDQSRGKYELNYYRKHHGQLRFTSRVISLRL